jgi:phosphoribosyl-ATP pyrophosphohydrolase
MTISSKPVKQKIAKPKTAPGSKTQKQKPAPGTEPRSKSTRTKPARTKPTAKAAAPRGEAPAPRQGAPAAGGSEVLDRLWGVVQARRDADPASSHSARLLGRGTAKVAQKFGEEAVECLIEAVAGNRMALVAESADVLYHLLVLWVDAGVRPDEVWGELVRREGVSGIAEKAARPRIETRKIP